MPSTVNNLKTAVEAWLVKGCCVRLRSGARKHYDMRPVLRGIFWNVHNGYLYVTFMGKISVSIMLVASYLLVCAV